MDLKKVHNRFERVRALVYLRVQRAARCIDWSTRICRKCALGFGVHRRDPRPRVPVLPCPFFAWWRAHAGASVLFKHRVPACEHQDVCCNAERKCEFATYVIFLSRTAGLGDQRAVARLMVWKQWFPHVASRPCLTLF